jgi:hypothetical protein
MTAQTTHESPRDLILHELSEYGATEPTTMNRIGLSVGGFEPLQMAQALIQLIQEGLVDQSPGGRGWYRLTERGRAAANVEPEANHLESVIPHPGGSALDVITGQLTVGVDSKGHERRWQIWNEIGTKPILVSGSTGSGGTNFLSGLIEAALLHYPVARTWLVDDNRQMKEHWDLVEKIGVNERYDDDQDEVITASDLLDQVLAVQRDRSRSLTQAGKKAWITPFDSLRLPLGVLVLGDLSEIVGEPELRRKLSLISKQARKTGIIIATHVHDLTLASFGQTPALQDFFAAGNMMIFRHAGQLVGRIVPSISDALDPIPAAFPDGSTTAGLGRMIDGTLIRTFWASGL